MIILKAVVRYEKNIVKKIKVNAFLNLPEEIKGLPFYSFPVSVEDRFIGASYAKKIAKNLFGELAAVYTKEHFVVLSSSLTESILFQGLSKESFEFDETGSVWKSYKTEGIDTMMHTVSEYLLEMIIREKDISA